MDAVEGDVPAEVVCVVDRGGPDGVPARIWLVGVVRRNRRWGWCGGAGHSQQNKREELERVSHGGVRCVR